MLSGKFIARERLRALMDAAVDAILLIDTQGRVQDCNRAGLRMFGYAEEELLGRNVSTLMPAPYRHEHDDYLARYLDTGEARIIGIGREVVARRRDGSEFPIDLAVGEVSHDGGTIGFAGFIRDLTERKAVEAELRAREHELDEHRERLMHAGRLGTMGEMAAGIAHEVNQPLTAITSYARACERLLDQQPPDLDLLRQTLAKIGEQAERAGDVIQGLRRFTRKQSLPSQPVDLAAVLRELQPLLGIDGRWPDYELTLDLADGPAMVMADPVQLQQIVMNLVRNATDAMNSGPGWRLQLRLSPQGVNWWQLEVEDDGPGLAAEVRERLFHPFVTSKPDGVGLGLSICRTIAEAHGGELDCVHSEPGRTIFRLLLPALNPGGG